MADSSKLESILELASLLNKQNDFQEILRITTLKASEIFNSSASSIVMVNPNTDKTIKTIMREGEDLDKKQQHLIQTNVIGWMNKNKQSFISKDLSSDTRFRSYIFSDFDSTSVICSNLKREGNVIGYIIVINNENEKCLTEDDLKMLDNFSSVVAPYLDSTQKISEYFKSKLTDDTLFSKYEKLGLIGKCKAFKELLNSIEAACKCDVRVLIRGNSGTGKELVAKALHKCGERRNRNFVAVDCGAIPENLIESELFGHVKGSFTGAVNDRKGLFEEADKGTLFMDEISNLPINMQSKLLRVLQENEVKILGSNKTVKVDVRIISACSSDLRNLISEGKFREDLYYRLNVYPIDIPPLNKRKDDISELSSYFLKRYSESQHKNINSIEKSVMKFLRNRSWHGNIRELENFIERAVTLASDNTSEINKSCLAPEYLKDYNDIKEQGNEDYITKPFQESVDEYEEELIKRALINCNWNQSKAARLLNISERTIRYKIQKLRIVKPES